jgi:hypothetical protein
MHDLAKHGAGMAYAINVPSTFVVATLTERISGSNLAVLCRCGTQADISGSLFIRVLP